MADDQLSELRNKRGQIKSKLTRFRTYLEGINKNNVNIEVITELEVRLEKVLPLYDEFNDIQGQIDSLQDSIDNEVDIFENSYFKLVSLAHTLCNEFKCTANSDYRSVNNDLNQGSGDSSKGHGVKSLVRLPPIKLPTFSGQYDSWLEFKDCFLALVHNNNALTDIQRFYYLRSSLECDAQQVIKSIEVSSDNYQIAWQMLQERYENKKLIIHNHLKAIFDHPVIIKESHLELRNLFDNITKHLRSLNSLGIQTDTWDSIIIFIICLKFDSITKRDWECFKCEQELPTIKDISNFLKQKCEMLEKLDMCSEVTNKGKVRGNSSRTFATLHENNKIKCYYCQKEHPIYRCEAFLKLNVHDRINAVKRLKLCLNCLRDSHPTWKCKLQKCIKCHKLHNSLLHLGLNKENNNQSQSTTATNNPQRMEQDCQNIEREVGVEHSTAFHASQTGGGVANNTDFSTVLLSTVLVRLINENKSIICRALLDSGSQSNFITEKVCKHLNLQCTKVNHIVKGVGDALAQISNEVKIKINSCNGPFKTETNCLVIPRITGKIPIKTFDRSIFKFPQGIKLADPNFNCSDNIDLLLGSNIFWSVLLSGHHNVGPNMPVLQNTEFGWVIAGNLYLNNLNSRAESSSFLNINNNHDSVNKTLERFWEIEELGPKKLYFSEEEKYCENYFKETVKKDSTNRYIVKIPFKDSINELGDSKTMALHRFNLLEKRLSKNNELKLQYTDFMSEYINLGHMSEVNAENEDGYFLPHHAVIKQASLTTKCRVVFDGSARSSSGLSLNDVQYIGPSLQQDIFFILIRFRMFKFVLNADITKMYRQILIDKEQRKFQKILWRSDPQQELKCYELNTVTYGTASAPYLAVRTLLQVADDNETQYPLIAKILRRDFYMDDLLTSSDDISEIVNVQQDISKILASSGFELRKWLCNDQNVIQHFKINEELNAAFLSIGEQNKTLGIYWDAQHDFISYKINIDSSIQTSQWNKRSILSMICQIYDPLGLLGPIVVNAKLIMQDLWKRKLDWDQELPMDVSVVWSKFYSCLWELNKLKIPRHASFFNCVIIELHGFSDASMRAYGCCVFIRCLTSSGQYIANLLCAKSRVAPIKIVSLPRLELCGAVLLANLMGKITEFLDIQFSGVYYWTDSTICLYWIKAEPSRWKLFVANRVQEIQNLTNVDCWRHVRSEQNPADLLSRGILVDNFITNNLWWFGPEWLLKNNSEWDTPEVEQLQNIPEEKSLACVNIYNNNNSLINELLNRFSSFKMFLKVFGYILQFISNCKVKKSERKCGVLKVSDIEQVLNKTIESVQKECFPHEYSSLKNKNNISNKSKILSLNPFIHNGLLRVGGRLKNSNIPFSSKHQIILPNNHILTKRILRDEHERLLHCGVQQLIFSIRQKYWPIMARNCCKYIINQCIRCYRAKPKAQQYLMGDLPDIRVNSFSIFENVGTDYGGPFLLKDRKTRGAKLTKAYICLFVCMCTKAVHIELVSELTSDAFLASLKRFISRRGKPNNIYSDNGSNYLGANNEINAIYNFLKDNSDVISQGLLFDKVKWHFIPSNSPTFGGLWEAGIKSIKSHLKRVLGNRSLTFEEFSTLLTQIEGILNSRPLCPMSSDPDDNTALTPSHFLIGRTLTVLPEYDLQNIAENRLDKWQRIQILVQQLWGRWQLEYLNELQMRQKWKTRCQLKLKVGSMVLVKDDKCPPLQWPLGRVTSMHPGPDGITRVVTVKVRGSELKRALSRICILPVEED